MDDKNTELSRYGLPTRFFIAAMAVSFALIAGYSIYSWGIRRDLHEIYANHIGLDRNLSRMRLLDEAMTMSARMAAVSGEEIHRQRYRELEPKLAALINELRRNQPRASLVPALNRLDLANSQMVKIERRALAYEGRRSKEATALLVSPEYLRHKRAYSEAIKDLETAAEDLIGTDDSNLRRIYLKDILASGVTLAVAFFSWLFAMAAIRRWRHEAPATVELLREREEQYRHLYNNVQEVAYSTDLLGKITDITPSIKKYSGFDREELIGKPVHSVYQDPAERTKLLKELLTKGEVDDYEVNLRTKDGRPLVVSVNAHMLRGPLGLPVGVEGTLRDISARKRSENAVREYAAKLAAILNTSPVAILTTDMNGTITGWNRMAEKMFGWTESEALGKFNPTVTQENLEGYRAFLERVRDGKAISDLEVLALRKDGTTLSVSVSETQMQDEHGRVNGVLGVLLDISGRRKGQPERSNEQHGQQES